MGGLSAAVSKTAAAPIERVKLLIQNQVRAGASPSRGRGGPSLPARPPSARCVGNLPRPSPTCGLGMR